MKAIMSDELRKRLNTIPTYLMEMMLKIDKEAKEESDRLFLLRAEIDRTWG